MEKIQDPSRRKNTKISFRTDEKTLTKLKAICRMENVTISSLIENVLTEHVLREDENVGLLNEKRQTQRKSCTFPTVLTPMADEDKIYYNGTVVSISPNSLQIVLHSPPEEKMLQKKFMALFSLPTGPYPILVQCTIIRMEYVHDQCLLAAKYTHASTTEKIIIDNFLNPNKVSPRHKPDSTITQ
jgi:hypothetical protein